MQFNTRLSLSSLELKTPALWVGMYKNQVFTTTARAIDQVSGGALSALKNEFKGEVGEVVVLRHLSGTRAERVVVVGLGDKEHYNPKSLLKVYTALAKYANQANLKEATDTLVSEPCKGLNLSQKAQLAARALSNASYRYTKTFSKANRPSEASLSAVTFLYATKSENQALKQGLERGEAIASGIKFARELGDLPPNYATPSYLAEQANELARQHKNVKVEILKRKQIEAMKMGAFLSVAAGSDEEPRFIILKYFGKSSSRANPKHPIVLVGKGVTFDSGGISLKPGLGMDEMKFDMCGAASVLAAFKTAVELKLPLDLVALVAATENLPSGHATKPGDVVTSLSGQTIEILNTDAEGRLILCDTLTYAERFKPKAVIDVATLTGACVVALGHVHSGLYANDEGLASDLLAAAQSSEDTVWRMPLDDAYQEQLKSNFADMQNIGGMPGGSVTAACFLSRFTKAYKWAHLDIAGTAWDKGQAKGATGRPVALLTQYLIDQSKS